MSLTRPRAASLYTPLPEDTIRCIRLTGTSLTGQHARNRDLAIECRIETVSLSDVRQKKTSYCALSYVWGSPKFPRWVICNGVLKAVTSNLYSALWHFTFGDDVPALLWIDALCIDQEDDADKAQQVSMMAQIYREAERVLIWLGTDPAANPALERFWTNLNTMGARKAMEDREAFDRGVAFINTADWFTRTWTVQEIVLAREARVCCGFFSIDWVELDELSGIVERAEVAAKEEGQGPWEELKWSDSESSSSGSSSPESSSPSSNGLSSDSQRSISPMVGSVSDGKSSPVEEISATASVVPVVEILSRLRRPHYTQNLTLYQLICATWDREATNPRDKLYALLGLWNGGASIVPDYSQSMLYAFADAAFTIAKEDKWLWLNMRNIKPLIITYREDSKAQQRILIAERNAPSVSWIPDLRDKNEEEAEKLVDPNDDWRFQGPKWPEPVFTHLHPSFVPDFARVGTNLLARGVILGTWRQVDTIQEVGWQYEGDGVFEGFPPCVAKFSVDDFHLEKEITFPSTAAVYEAMLTHIGMNCTCDQDHGTFLSSGRNDSTMGSENIGTIAWLCFLFGKTEPLILKPLYSTERPGIVFQIANRLPYNHPWAALILRAGHFNVLRQDEDAWHKESLLRSDNFRFKISSGGLSDVDDRVRLIEEEVRRDSERGDDDSVSLQDRQLLSLAFRNGSDGEVEALKTLAKTYDVPDLTVCHLNWIPTTFEIVGCP